MEEPDYSYVGSGHIMIKEYGAAAAFLPIGNCATLNFAPQVNTLQLPDFTQPGGGVRNRIDRISDVQYNFTFHDFNGENFARFMRGTSSKVIAGTATSEDVVAYKGGWSPLSKIANDITTVTGPSGTPSYIEGEDYLLDNGGIYIPAGSDVIDPVSGAPNIEVTYGYEAHTVTEAFVNAAKQYSLQFLGLNEARSGKAVRITAHKVSGGVLATLGLLGEDYGAGEVSGSLLADTTKGIGLSKFFQALVVD